MYGSLDEGDGRTHLRSTAFSAAKEPLVTLLSETSFARWERRGGRVARGEQRNSGVVFGDSRVNSRNSRHEPLRFIASYRGRRWRGAAGVSFDLITLGATRKPAKRIETPLIRKNRPAEVASIFLPGDRTLPYRRAR